MTLQQIKPELFNEWKKKGELFAIFRCERCYKKIPFYKSYNELVNMISLAWIKDHKYCYSCERKLDNNFKTKKKVIPRINLLLERYEFEFVESEEKYRKI